MATVFVLGYRRTAYDRLSETWKDNYWYYAEPTLKLLDIIKQKQWRKLSLRSLTFSWHCTSAQVIGCSASSLQLWICSTKPSCLQSRLGSQQGRIYYKPGPCSEKMWMFHLFPNHYFNISGLLPCCKKWREKKNLSFRGAPFLWGPLFGRTCWTCLNLPLAPSNYFLIRNLKYRLRGTYRRRITEDRCEGMVWESKEKILFLGHKQLRTKV